jgi:hypothetical protein
MNEQLIEINNKPQKTQKKRGRPRKSEVQFQKTIVMVEHNPEDDELILNIPLKDDEEVERVTEGFVQTLSENSQSSGSSGETKKKNITDLMNEINKKNAIIKKLRKEIDKIKEMNDGTIMSIEMSAIKNSKKTELDNKLFSVQDGKAILMEKTNIHCWWCCHQFDTLPCFIPDKFYNDTYYVFGCFCSPSCAFSYNLNMTDQRVNIRHSLLRRLYFKIFNVSFIPFAPQKELLKMFGGSLSIEEFRDSRLMLKRDIYTLLPPMVPLIPVVEEIVNDNKIEK